MASRNLLGAAHHLARLRRLGCLDRLVALRLQVLARALGLLLRPLRVDGPHLLEARVGSALRRELGGQARHRLLAGL